MTGSGFPYFPMGDDTFISYSKLAIAGLWHADTMKLDVNTQQGSPCSPPRLEGKPCDIRVSFSKYNSPAASGFFQFWHYIDQLDNPPQYNRGLVYTPNILSDKLYLGEVRNELGWAMYPPECILTYNPIVGETIQGVSRVYENDQGGPLRGVGNWTYKTIAHYEDWGGFQDCWRTALYESTGFQYNYIFARGIGIVDLWFINPSTGLGTRYWAIDWSGKDV